MTRMKESGIDWIGQIPEEWEVVRLQDIGDYRKGPFGSAITIDMFIEKSPCSYKVYEQKNAIRGNCEIGEAYIPKSVYNNLKNFSVYPLDIIVSCAGTIGKCYILPEDCEQGIINQALMRVRVNKSVNLEYFLYIFDIVLSYAAIKYSNGSAIKNIPPFNVLNKLRVTLPSNIEQHQIVNYLDKKTAQLDKAKALLEEQIQKLKDYRASLIYETVTKGLDKTVPMKDSGIDWIGQVPGGWGVKPLKYLASYDDETLTQSEINSNQKINYVDIGAVEFTKGINSYQEISMSEAPSRARKIAKKGDTIISTVRTYLKAIAYVNDDYIVSTGFCVVRPKKVNSKYLNYAIMSDSFTGPVSKYAWGVSYPAISSSQLVNIPIPFPESIEEQLSIVDYLDHKMLQINQLIDIKQEQIDNINKQRQTLIYDYVTGKRRGKEI